MAPKPLEFPTTSSVPKPKLPLEAFVEYVQYNLSEPQARHLLVRLIEEKRLTIKVPQRKPWRELREVASQYSPAELRGFVEELKSRKQDGAWPVQPRRPRPGDAV